MRICSKCGNNPKLDWHTSYCRECYRELDRKRYYRDRKKRLEINKQNYQENKQRWIIKAKRRRELYPEKYKANYTLRNAVKAGKIIKGKCEVCGDTKTHGHHDDYSKPLEVRWLCIKHHSEYHRTYNQALSDLLEDK